MTRAGGVSRAKRTQLTILQVDSLGRLSWLVHGFSTRKGGFSNMYGPKTLNLGFTKDDSSAAVEKNRELLLEKLGCASRERGWQLITVRQIHSDLIHRVEERPKVPLSGDGLITTKAGLLLGILTADCLPVLLADPKKRAVGVFHAGWRGTMKRIVEKGVGEMRRWFQSQPSDLVAAIGPGIHACCYEVGEEVREKFRGQFPYADELFAERHESDELLRKYPLLFLTARPPGHAQLSPKIFLDLVEANRRQLLSAGLLPSHVAISDLCTSCRPDLLFSHRAEKGKTGRMMAVVGLRA